MRKPIRSATNNSSRVLSRSSSRSGFSMPLPTIVDLVSDKSLKKEKGVKLSVIDLSHDGRGVAKHNGQIVFVPNTLPSETIIADVMPNNKNFSEATLRELVINSPDRVTPACAHAGSCGGCQLQHLSYQGQVSIKQTQLQQGLERKGLSCSVVANPIISDPFYYRRRAKFIVNQRKQLCFRSLGGKEQVEIDQCLLLEPSLNNLLQTLQSALLQKQLPAKAVMEIELIAFDQLVLVMRVNRHWSETQKNKWQEWLLMNAVNYWVVQTPSETDEAIFGLEKIRLTDQVNDLSLSVSWDSFIQANKQVNQQMVKQAIAWLTPSVKNRVLDLFCGIGNFSFALAQTGATVLGLENNSASLMVAKLSAESLKMSNISFLSADLFNTQTQLPTGYDSVLLDPPWDGADQVCQKLKKQKSIQKIVYVSCHQGSLLRDLATLTSGGFKIIQIGLIDQFPQTYHVESMVLLTR